MSLFNVVGIKNTFHTNTYNSTKPTLIFYIKTFFLNPIRLLPIRSQWHSGTNSNNSNNSSSITCQLLLGRETCLSCHSSSNNSNSNSTNNNMAILDHKELWWSSPKHQRGKILIKRMRQNKHLKECVNVPNVRSISLKLGSSSALRAALFKKLETSNGYYKSFFCKVSPEQEQEQEFTNFEKEQQIFCRKYA